MSKKTPSSKYNPHLSPEEVKKHSINIKFTAAEFAEIMEVVEFSGEKRMNMCCTGVMKYVRELKAQMEEAQKTKEPKKQASKTPADATVSDKTVRQLYEAGMEVLFIARQTGLTTKQVRDILGITGY